jgi:phytoene dehydrogenase-like protein
MTRYDVAIVGGGHNGLVAASILARAGLKTVVLERSDRTGGCLATSEIAPGFRVPALAHRVSIDPLVSRALALERHGLQILRSAARVFAPAADGRGLTIWNDAGRAAQSIAAFSATDAGRYGSFLASLRAVGAVVHSALASAAPALDAPTGRDLFELLKTGRRFRALGRADAHRLLRWLPMPVYDFVREWFESEPLRATIAADGVLGAFLGPRSAGSTAVLLLLSSSEGHPIAPGWSARGGPGAVADAIAAAARASGVEIRTAAGVRRVLVREGAAAAAVLETGEEIPARHIVSNLDPRRTFLDLIEPVHLTPEFSGRVHHIRMRGTLAKVNYALGGLPRFTALAGGGDSALDHLSGCVRLSPDLDAIERAFDAAKYGTFADVLSIELSIPSVLDDSLAPPGQHVVSAYVQYVPQRLRDGSWDTERDRLAKAVTRTIAARAPGFEQLIVGQQVTTPADLEAAYGLTGGHIFHGELALDQLLVGRPLLGWSRYATPIRNLWLCGTGTHPGTGADGRSGLLAAREIVRQTRS